MSAPTMVGDFERHDLPSGDVVFYRDSNHAYYSAIRKDGDRYVGPNDARLPSPSTVAKVYDLQLADRLASAAAKAGPEWFRRKDRRAQQGTNVHAKVLEALAAGGQVPSLSDVDESERGYSQGVLGWWAAADPEVVASEQVVYSSSLRFAGRVDLIVEVGGQRLVVDLKTGFVGESAHVQAAGYALAADESGFGPIDGTAILKVWDDGRYALLPGLSTPLQFANALRVYREGKTLGSAVSEQLKAAA